MKYKPLLTLVIPLIHLASCTKDEIGTGTFKDPRDGQKYRIAQIGTQTWMVENFKYKTSGSWCYENAKSNCDEYGLLYSHDAAMTCAPEGWHLPTEQEFKSLLDFLAARGPVLDQFIFGDSSVFHAKLGGNGANQDFDSQGIYCGFWTSTSFSGTNSVLIYANMPQLKVGVGWGSNSNGYSVRLLKD
jgi:uncharacterized protein (TIGR02145 family)